MMSADDRAGILPRPHGGMQRRRALKAFMTEHGLSGRTVALSNDTYDYLVQGATDLLGVQVTVGQLRGEDTGETRVPTPIAQLRALAASGKLDRWHVSGDHAAEISAALRLIPKVIEQLDKALAELRKVG